MIISRTVAVLLVIGILILAAVWYLLFGKSNTDGTILTLDAPATEVERQFLLLTEQINPVEFDTSILTDSRFLNLIDIRTAIAPEESGRPNPFEPLPGLTTH